MMVVILTGGINLSLTYHASLAGVVMAIILRDMNASGANPAESILISIAAALIVALVCGLLNGFLVAYLKVTPILATLGTMILFKGIGQNLTQGYSISGFPEAFDIFGNGTVAGIPVSFMILILIVVVMWFLLEKTPWGIQVHMVGNNPLAVEYSGINVKKVLFKAYIASALLCFFATLIMTSRYNSMKPEYGYSYLLQSVLAVVLGGTSINGGYGKVVGTLLSVLILQIMSSGLNIFGLNKFFIDVIMGCMLIFVLALNFVLSKRSNRKLLAAKNS
jgi:ribose/xylose/arabinose/galactoside ABC-type transport system permease subunit